MPLGKPALLGLTFKNNSTLPDLFSEARECYTAAPYIIQTAGRLGRQKDRRQDSRNGIQ